MCAHSMKRFALFASTLLLWAIGSSAMAQNASMQQCANGSQAAPRSCTGSAWVVANINRKNGHYTEDDSVPLRVLLNNLSVGSTYTITLQWDATESGRHAYDYLTSFDRTESFGNDPCSGVTGCASSTTFFIPTDPQVTSAGVTQAPGVFRMYGATIVAVSAYTVIGSYDGRSSTNITITFDAYQSTPVLAFGAHLASRLDWSALGGSAADIPGASFHVRLYELGGKNVGNQDRSISDVRAY